MVTSPPPLNIGSSNVVNKIPIPNANQIPGMVPQQGASIELRNPRESGGVITYSLNNCRTRSSQHLLSITGTMAKVIYSMSTLLTSTTDFTTADTPITIITTVVTTCQTI